MRVCKREFQIMWIGKCAAELIKEADVVILRY